MKILNVKKLADCYKFKSSWIGIRIRILNTDLDPDSGEPIIYGSGSSEPIIYGSNWIRIQNTAMKTIFNPPLIFSRLTI